MTSETDLDQSPARAVRRSSAERMRAYRRRRRSGLRCYAVKLGRAELDDLVTKGYLSPEKRNDRHAIELAIDDFLFDFLRVRHT
jgi:hypothetical protein